MSSPSSPPVSIDLHALRSHRCVAVIAVLLGFLSPWVALPALGGTGAAACGALLAAVLITSFFHQGGLTESPGRLTWHSDGQWLLTRDAREQPYRLAAGARCGAGWAWLPLVPADGLGLRHHLLLTELDLARPELRRLIVRLRLEGGRPCEPSVPP